jgi:hypothetical protein
MLPLPTSKNQYSTIIVIGVVAQDQVYYIITQ